MKHTGSETVIFRARYAKCKCAGDCKFVNTGFFLYVYTQKLYSRRAYSCRRRANGLRHETTHLDRASVVHSTLQTYTITSTSDPDSVLSGCMRVPSARKYTATCGTWPVRQCSRMPGRRYAASGSPNDEPMSAGRVCVRVWGRWGCASLQLRAV